MSRARNVKPGFFKNEDLAECSPLSRLCFIGLWMLADRDGRIEDRPRRIKGELFPFEPCDVDELLSELEHRGFVLRYEVDGLKVLWIKNFEKHQHPHPNEPASVLPAYSCNAITNSCNSMSRMPSSLNPELLNPSSLNPESLKEESLIVTGKKPDFGPSVREVYGHYRSFHPRSAPTLKSDSEAYRKIVARLKEGYTTQDLIEAIDGNHRSLFHCGKNDHGTKHNDLTLILRDSEHVRKFIEMPSEAEQESAGTRQNVRAADLRPSLDPNIFGPPQ